MKKYLESRNDKIEDMDSKGQRKIRIGSDMEPGTVSEMSDVSLLR